MTTPLDKAEGVRPVIITRGKLKCELWLGDCFDLASKVGVYNHVITDPPFSERTHAGHDGAVSLVNETGHDSTERRELGYAAWHQGHISAFCALFNPDGWAVVINDHTNFPHFEREMKSNGRYVFAPLPSFTSGRSVRLVGDGPASWTDWICVSRTTKQARWGSLSGGYVNRQVQGGNRIGGKPIGLMCNLVNDYSREGDTVIDPCMGAGTTGLACLMTGRNFIGIEKDEETFNRAVERIQNEANQSTIFDLPTQACREAMG